MTHDQLRTGAALVRALVEGDESARGVLADWIDDHGLPQTHPTEAERSASILRRPEHLRPWCGNLPTPVVWLIPESEWAAVPMFAPLGCWPRWAWNQGYPDDAAPGG